MTEMAQTSPRRRAVLEKRRLARAVFRLSLAFAALLICWQVAAARFTEFDGAEFWAHLSNISPVAVGLAFLAAGISYAAISFYDLIAFRALGLAIPAGTLLRTGAVATALGQVVGFGLIIGAFTRWRLLKREGVDQATAAGASLIVTSGFLGGLLVLGGIVATTWPADISAMTGIAQWIVRATGLCIIGMLCAALLAGHLGVSARIFGRVIAMPRPKTTFSQVILAVIDVFFAAAVLWLMMPAAAGLTFGIVFIAYTGVLAICLLANTPGGVGPFEGALLFALPLVPIEALLAGIIAFRALYYVVPGLLALVVLIDAETGDHLASVFRGPRQAKRHTTPGTSVDHPALKRALATSGRAEDELIHLGDKSFLASPSQTAFLMYRAYGRALVAIGDPIGNPHDTAILCDRFRALAQHSRLTPVFYKTGPALSHAARRAGMSVGRIGREAIIDLSSFTMADRERREVRRKVRKAAKTGVSIIAHAPGAAPLSAYRELCADWQSARHAPETTFSMGTCEPRYLSRFPIYEAQVAGKPVAFISLWRSGDGQEWALDIMRHGSDAPSGVMQALVVAACDGARAAGAKKFNLCLAPLSGLSPPLNFFERMGNHVYNYGDRFHRLQGLHRFKAAFRPTWHPRYIARARGIAGLYGLWAVYRMIHTKPRTAETLTTQGEMPAVPARMEKASLSQAKATAEIVAAGDTHAKRNFGKHQPHPQARRAAGR